MTEKPPNHDTEQADSDVTITMSNHQSSTTLKKLTVLPSPASLSQLGLLCPTSSQTTLNPLVGPILRPMSETEKRPGMQVDVPSPHSTVISTSSDQISTDDGLLANTEASGLTTGCTTASGQTEATSPAVSTPGDQTALSWRRRVLHFGPGDPFPSFSPRNQEIRETENEVSSVGRQNPFIKDSSMNAYQLASTCLENIPVSGFVESAPEFEPSANGTTQIDKATGIATSSVSPLIKTASIQGCNPLAVEWRPIDRIKDMATDDSLKVSQTPRSRLERTLKVPQISTICVPEQLDNARVLEWAKNVPPLQLPEMTTPSPAGESGNYGLERMRQGVSLALRRTTIATPVDTTPLYQRPTLAQRRAEKQFGHSPAELVQSAPSTAPLRLATLHATPGIEVSATTAPSQTAFSAAFQATQSQPFHSASHTQSLTWKRPTDAGVENRSVNPEFTKWTKVEQDLLRMGLIKRVPGKPDSGSFVVPHTFEQWLEFRAGRAEDALAENAAKIRQRNCEAEAAEKLRRMHSIDNTHGYLTSTYGPGKRVKVELAMGGKNYSDGRGAVLAHPSNWSPWYQPTEGRPEAPWPCPEEMKEEGDERHTSAFGRFPALPRAPGNPTVVWKVKPVIPALPFDDVWRLPNKDTWAELYSQKQQDNDKDFMEGLIGQSLLNAIDV